jgi:hypothetical protein
MADAICRITWQCKRCAAEVTQQMDADPYQDITPVPPDGWDYASDGNTHCCGICLAAVRAAPNTEASE